MRKTIVSDGSVVALFVPTVRKTNQDETNNSNERWMG